MDLSFILYFLAGVLQDILFTLNIRYVALHKVGAAVITSFFTVVVSMLVLYKIIAELDPSESILAILIYAAGIATGTYLAMKFKISGKK